MGEPELKTEQQIIGRFQELRSGVATLLEKIADLQTEAAEHDLVIKALKPMDKERRCYRMIGDVLVERTVGEALPAVQRNRDGLQNVLNTLEEQLATQQKQLEEFQERYSIRIRGQGDAGETPKQEAQKGSSGQSSGQGVLV
jgi:prefoldin subunit 2